MTTASEIFDDFFDISVQPILTGHWDFFRNRTDLSEILYLFHIDIFPYFHPICNWMEPNLSDLYIGDYFLREWTFLKNHLKFCIAFSMTKTMIFCSVYFRVRIRNFRRFFHISVKFAKEKYRIVYLKIFSTSKESRGHQIKLKNIIF